MSSHQTQYEQAKTYISQRKHEQALSLLRSLLNHTHIIDYEYQEWMNSAAELYEKYLNDPLAAAYVLLAACAKRPRSK